MKQYILILLMATLACTVAAGISDRAGEYGYKFLNIPVSPVSQALAGRGLHSLENSASWLWQPASAMMQVQNSVSASHSTWIGDTAYSSLVYSRSSRTSHVGFALRNLSYGEIEQRDDSAVLLGYYSPADLGLTGNYALRVTPSIYVGANLGVYYQKIDTASSLALSTDIGISSLTFVKDSRLSFSVRNLGLSNKMDHEQVKLPVSFDLDANKGFALGEQYLNLETGIVITPDSDPQTHLATELTLLKRINLRTGYKFNHDSADFSAGIGFNVSHFVVDYAFVPYTEGLGNVHSFGLSYRF